MNCESSAQTAAQRSFAKATAIASPTSQIAGKASRGGSATERRGGWEGACDATVRGSRSSAPERPLCSRLAVTFARLLFACSCSIAECHARSGQRCSDAMDRQLAPQLASISCGLRVDRQLTERLPDSGELRAHRYNCVRTQTSGSKPSTMPATVAPAAAPRLSVAQTCLADTLSVALNALNLRDFACTIQVCRQWAITLQRATA